MEAVRIQPVCGEHPQGRIDWVSYSIPVCRCIACGELMAFTEMVDGVRVRRSVEQQRHAIDPPASVELDVGRVVWEHVEWVAYRLGSCGEFHYLTEGSLDHCVRSLEAAP